MATYIMLTKIAPGALRHPITVEELSRAVAERVQQECRGVKWLANYAVLGPYDYVDIFEAPGEDEATKVALLVRSFGHATTEIWTATPWSRFVDIARGLEETGEEQRPTDGSEYFHIQLKGQTS